MTSFHYPLPAGHTDSLVWRIPTGTLSSWSRMRSRGNVSDHSLAGYQGVHGELLTQINSHIMTRAANATGPGTRRTMQHDRWGIAPASNHAG